jgi:hypothetical protein
MRLVDDHKHDTLRVGPPHTQVVGEGLRCAEENAAVAPVVPAELRRDATLWA